jgi:addiction module HigA family antidote
MPMFNPPHPGKVLREFMGDRITPSAFARHLRISTSDLSLILEERASISPLLALKLDEAIGTSDGLWLRLQVQYDVARARRRKRKKVALLPLAA